MRLSPKGQPLFLYSPGKLYGILIYFDASHIGMYRNNSRNSAMSIPGLIKNDYTVGLIF